MSWAKFCSNFGAVDSLFYAIMRHISEEGRERDWGRKSPRGLGVSGETYGNTEAALRSRSHFPHR